MKIPKTLIIKKIEKLSFKRKLFIVAGLLVLGGALVFVRHVQIQKRNREAVQGVVIEDTASVMAQAHTAANGGDYAAAVGIIKEYTEAEKDNAQKYEAMLILGNYLVMASQAAEAFDVYQKAELLSEDKEDTRLLFGIAQSAEFKGDLKLALKYYKKLLAVLDTEAPKDQEESFFHKDIRARVKDLENS